MEERLSALTTQQYQNLETKELMRVLAAKAMARARGCSPEDVYTQRWGSSPMRDTVKSAFAWETKAIELQHKAAVTPGSTVDPAWAKPLVTSRLTTGFVGLVRQASVIGKLPVSMVPFNTSLPVQISGASMAWVGEGLPKPVSKLGFGQLNLIRTKASGIIVVSAELMSTAVSGSEQALHQILSNEIVRFTDAAFLSAAAATTASPAGILNGVTVSASIAATISAFFAARPNAITPTWITSPANVGALSVLDPNVPTHLRGYPLVLSPSAGANLILVDAPAIAVADDGVELDTTNEALLQMDDAPTPATAATVYLSLWQDNLTGIKAERFLNWQAAAGSVQFTTTFT